jgi:hypothetical protein
MNIAMFAARPTKKPKKYDSNNPMPRLAPTSNICLFNTGFSLLST